MKSSSERSSIKTQEISKDLVGDSQRKSSNVNPVDTTYDQENQESKNVAANANHDKESSNGLVAG